MVYNKPSEVLWVTTINTYSINGMLTQRNVSGNGLILSKGNAKCIIEISLKKLHLFHCLESRSTAITKWETNILAQCPPEKLSP